MSDYCDTTTGICHSTVIAGTHTACQYNACVTVSNTAYSCTNLCSSDASCASCAANAGTACASAPNNCGSTNPGTIQCDGSCSATPPPNQASCAASVAANIWADSTSLTSGQSTVIHWTVSNSTSAVITSSPVDPKFDSRPVTNTAGASDNTSNLSQTTTYTITAQGSGGPATKSVTVNVTPLPNDAQCVSITTDKTSYTVGDTYNATVVMSNIGTNNWIGLPPSGYSLGSQDPAGNTKWGMSSVPLPTSPAYRYVKVLEQDSGGSPYVGTYGFREIQSYDGSGNLLTPVSCTADPADIGGPGTTNCQYTYDNNPATHSSVGIFYLYDMYSGWVPYNKYSGYVVLDLGAPKSLSQIKILPYSYLVKSIIYVSNDGTNWSTVNTFNNLADNTWYSTNVGFLPYSQSGQNVTFSFTGTVGASAVGSNVPFSWQMQQTGVGYFGQKCSTNVTVNSLPSTISLNPTYFLFGGTVGGLTPSTQNMVVGNSGASTLNWTATTGQSWCHVSPSSGSVAAGSPGSNVTVSVDAPTAALVGTNNCNISVSATGASNSPQFAFIQYVVQAGNPGTGSSHLACQGSGSSAACVWVSGAGANSCATDADCGNTGGGGGGSPVNADSAVCSKIILTWQSGAGATGYNIYRANHPGTPGAILATVGNVNSYTDNGTVVGTKYDYWVESISGSLGGTGNKIPSNTNSTGIASVSCGSPPAAPTNPTWDNHATNAAVACNTIKFTWTDNSTNEDGFKIYKGPSGSAFPGSGLIATINSTSVAGTGQVYTYTYSIGSDAAPYQYWVIAYNTYGNSSSVAFNGGSTIVNVACVAQLGSSDKLITAVNNVPISGVSSCNGVNGASTPLPSYLTPKASDVFSFSVNICNSGSVDATSLKVTDSLTSLQMPAGGFGAKYDGNNLSYVGACSGTSFPASSGNYCAYGTAPNQTLLFNLTNYTVPAGTSRALTFNAQLPPASSITISNPRFQNSAHIDFAGSATGVNVYTPLQMFSVGNRVPVIEEK